MCAVVCYAWVFVARCRLLFVGGVCCLLSAVCGLLVGMRCCLFVACCFVLFAVVWCLLCVVVSDGVDRCLFSVVFCLLLLVVRRVRLLVFVIDCCCVLLARGVR